MVFRRFSWKEFDECVEVISNKCYKYNLSGVYGIPRGGICLAVALSHKLNIDLQKKPQNYSLIVDDIYDSGLTLNKYKKINNAKFFVLFSKKKLIWFESINISRKNEWIIFPWENEKNSIKERTLYRLKKDHL